MALTPEEAEARSQWFETHWRKHVPFNNLVGLDIIDWEPGFVRARLPFQERLSAHDGIFHGGVLATSIDTIGMGAIVAGHDFNLGSRFTTVSITIQYMAVAPHEDVLIEGRCGKRGRRLNFSRATVLTGAGKILAEGVLTVSASGERPRIDRPEAERDQSAIAPDLGALGGSRMPSLGSEPGTTTPSGPLAGVKVIEVAGMGAAPYTAMLLSDMGADVIRVDRPGARSAKAEKYALSRGRRSVTIDMKQPAGLDAFMRLVAQADVLLEGFRPGVAERLGFGPGPCLAGNPRLVYARMTGWGQQGPMSQMAGHDLNYLGLTGALTLLQRGRAQPATPPGFIADFGGGGLMLAFGIVCALLEARGSGAGQVIDGAMVDGVASLTTLIYAMTAQDRWALDEPGTNFCDGGSPYYDSYETSDGRWVAVAALEPQFYLVMLDKLGLSPDDLPDRDDKANWPKLKELFAGIFRTRTRDDWAETFDGSDACVTPVLSFREAASHPHNTARGTFTEAFGVVQPAPAPRFSRTPGAISGTPPVPGAQSEQVLLDWGLRRSDVDALLACGAVGPARHSE